MSKQSQTPSSIYEQDLKTGLIQDDPEQRRVLQYLDELQQQLFAAKKQAGQPWWHRVFARQDDMIKGCYLWGGVGIGKTYLMDLFYDAMTDIPKKRIHFHHFMQLIHAQLKQLQGHENPLQHIAKQFVQDFKLLCFDEFDVTDITDAMLLAGLLQALFEEGICLVATSNHAPHDVYKHGLQRQRFLPAIHLIDQHCHIVSLASEQDYRKQHLQHAGSYFYPLNAESEAKMAACFHECVLHHIGDTPVEVLGREIDVIKRGQDIVWFDFDVLCHTPRSQEDYLEIAKRYSTVMLSHLPVIGAEQDDKITYLIYLIDVFYDHHVNLILSADAPIAEIYTAGRKLGTFERTKSRLLEMQSAAYQESVR